MTQTKDNINREDDNRSQSLWHWLKTRIGLRGAPDTTRKLEHEIQELLEDGEEMGLISSHEEQLINSIFDFRQTVASEIMTPAAEMAWADVSSSVEELIRLITEEGYTRIPLYSGSQDNVVGILHAKDLLKICSLQQSPPLKLTDDLKPPMIIGESKPITELLRDFQSKKNHMAIVVDEFGGVRGLITLEDVIEEIVGEIDDEHDQEERELMVVDEQTVVVDAKIDIEEVEEHFNIHLPEGPYESVGGLIINSLSRVPQNGDTVNMPPLTFKVLAADPRRVRTVRIRKN